MPTRGARPSLPASLSIGNGGTGEYLASPSVADNGAIVFNHSDALTYSGVISGKGVLTKSGTGPRP